MSHRLESGPFGRLNENRERLCGHGQLCRCVGRSTELYYSITPTARAFTIAVGNPSTFTDIQYLSPDRVRDSDLVSISSTASGRKRRLWRRSSTASTAQASPKRKTMGLASAIVASVSNSAAAPSSPSRRDAIVASPLASPPRRKGSMVKRSPALAGHHAAASQSSVDSNALQLSPSTIRSRHDSLSAKLQEHESDYVSSVDGHDDEVDDDDSEDDDLLAGLNDGDMPVTGFAVASNKRNADFHELFKTIPEGDYLIEGAGALCLTLHIYFMPSRLWLRLAT
jgi:hypothetical protein